MRLSSLSSTIFAAALAIAGTSTGAGAQAQQPGYQQPPAGYRENRRHDLVWIESRVGTAVLTLQREHAQYGGGHRAAALGYLHDAHRELRAAVDFANQNSYQPIDLGVERGFTPPDRNAPDRGVYNAQRHAQIWIEMLQRDNRDFGGHRAAAIDLLQRAENELTAALQAGQ